MESPRFGITLSTYEGNLTAGKELLAGLAVWVKAADPELRVTGAVGGSVRVKPAAGWAVPGAPEGQVTLPWDDPHHDAEIGTEHLVSMSKWLTKTALAEGPGDFGYLKVAAAMMNLTSIARGGLLAQLPGHIGIGMHKSQGGATPVTVALFNETSLNPAVLDAVGFITSQWRVPSLPQLPPSVAVLKTLWPRLEKYAITSKADPLYSLCAAAATDGGDAEAAACLAGWTVRVPAILDELNVLKAELFRQFPPVRSGVEHYAGSYWNEADYYEPEWQAGFWGAENYAKLYKIKQAVDPAGMFTCHHCVGSELWDASGNCPRSRPA